MEGFPTSLSRDGHRPFQALIGPLAGAFQKLPQCKYQIPVGGVRGGGDTCPTSKHTPGSLGQGLVKMMELGSGRGPVPRGYLWLELGFLPLQQSGTT